MNWIYNDGGREDAGYKGSTSDCVCRSIAIATGKPYQEIYDALNAEASNERKGKRKRGKSSARTGVYKRTYRLLLESLGWKFTPTMSIGSGCKVHLTDGELPMGRLIVSVSKHYTTVIDGVIHDTFDPQREIAVFVPDAGRELKPGESRNINGILSISRRCVYGYWSQAK